MVYFKDNMVDAFGRNWPAHLQSSVQADALNSIQSIAAVNKQKKPRFFVVGPSNARPFYRAITADLKDRRGDVVQLVSGSQVLPDAIRLIDQIDLPGSTIVFVFSIYKFSTMWFERTLIETHYLNGAGGKYFASSPTFEAVWDDFKKQHEVVASDWMKGHWRLFQPFMPYAYYFNDLVDEKIKRPIGRAVARERVSFSPDTIPASKSVGIIEMPRVTPPETTATLPVTQIKSKEAFVVAQASQACNPVVRIRSQEEMAAEYPSLTARKLKEFRTRLDYTRPQFKQSLDESMKMLGLLIDLTERRGMKFIAVEAPVPEVIDKELAPELPDYSKQIDALAAAHPHIKVIRPDAHWSNQQSLFSDYVHLSNEGEAYYHDYLISPFKELR